MIWFHNYVELQSLFQQILLKDGRNADLPKNLLTISTYHLDLVMRWRCISNLHVILDTGKKMYVIHLQKDIFN